MNISTSVIKNVMTTIGGIEKSEERQHKRPTIINPMNGEKMRIYYCGFQHPPLDDSYGDGIYDSDRERLQQMQTGIRYEIEVKGKIPTFDMENLVEEIYDSRMLIITSNAIHFSAASPLHYIENVPKNFLDGFTMTYFVDPILCEGDVAFEKKRYEAWLKQGCSECPCGTHQIQNFDIENYQSSPTKEKAYSYFYARENKGYQTFHLSLELKEIHKEHVEIWKGFNEIREEHNEIREGHNRIRKGQKEIREMLEEMDKNRGIAPLTPGFVLKPISEVNKEPSLCSQLFSTFKDCFVFLWKFLKQSFLLLCRYFQPS